MTRFYRQLLTDILIGVLVYATAAYIHQGNFVYSFVRFIGVGFLFYLFHYFISLTNRKYETSDVKYRFQEMTTIYVNSWLQSSGLALLILIVFQIDWISRQIILTNLFGLISLQLVHVVIIHLFRSSVELKDADEIASSGVLDVGKYYPVSKGSKLERQISSALEILKIFGDTLEEYLTAFVDVHADTTLVLHAENYEDILGAKPGKYKNLVNFHKLNNVLKIRQFIEAANSRLPMDGLMIAGIETKEHRKLRFMEKYPPLLNRIYYMADFAVMRIMPKLPFTRRLYFKITRGKKRVISKAELLGRLYAGGFSLVSEKDIAGRYLVVARKVSAPLTGVQDNYGPVIYLNRVGLHGKMIRVFKLRTMHPYSEYLQEYIHGVNSLADNGKIRDDFRVTTLGRFFRKYWIDELPMLVNLLKGEMKLVGVRPLSRHFFSLYTPELQEKRCKYKPGLIPPYYVDLPNSLEEIMASEMKYLEAYEKSPFRTDLKYFFAALNNIIFRKARSN